MFRHEVPAPLARRDLCWSVCLRAVRFEESGKPISLTLIEHAETDTTTDTGKAGDSVGDILTFANKVCECNWTAFLADGQITAEGPFYDAKDSSLTVAGGTGAYDGMHGQLKLHARDAKGSEYDFAYEISK